MERKAYKISKDFSILEFTQSEMAKDHLIINTITSPAVQNSVIALVNNVLQPLRDTWGKVLKINSGYRCPKLNALVGGVPTSQHLKGEAADIATDGEKGSYELAKLAKALKLPFDQMILYPTFVHFSHSRVKNRGQIRYNWRYKGQKL